MRTWLAIFLCLSIGPSVHAEGPITEFVLPSEGHRVQMVAVGPDGNLWLTESAQHNILRVTLRGEITIFAVPGPKDGVLQGIAAGPDGNLWFTSRDENAIRRMSVRGENTGSFTVPSQAVKPTKLTKGAWPRVIAPGPDGNLWFAEMAANKIGRITPKGEFKEFAIPTPDSAPYGIVAGPDKRIWFTESSAGKVGRLDPETGKIDEFPLSSAKAFPRDIAAGPDGNLWFTENAVDQIGRITPTGELKEFALAKESRPIGITAGPDGNVWFTEFAAGKIGRITPAGVVTEFALPTAQGQPVGIVTGPDGNLWFGIQANRVGRLDVKAAGK